MCNHLIREFLRLCEEIGVLVATEKTEWADECIVFLGVLLDGRHLMMRLPLEKRLKALTMLRTFIDKRKATVKELQELCGYLNFLCKVIFPGRPFIRRMYVKYSNVLKVPHPRNADDTCHIITNYKLKLHHHVRLDAEFKANCKVWIDFLDVDKGLQEIVNCPMIDLLSPDLTSTEICFYSDASAGKMRGFVGCIYNSRWLRGDWNGFIEAKNPSIKYLELYALCAGIFT